MDSTFSFDPSSIVYRPIEKHEQQQAVDMWCSIFKHNADCFERYFSPDASPHYQDGDALGAWHNDKLVSAVYIRRVKWQSSEDNEQYLLFGGIANVATVADYQRQGLSRHLLRMAIEKMEKNKEFDMSILGTEKYSHYAALGWKQVPEPNRVIIDWKSTLSLDNDGEWRVASDLLSENFELLLKIHSNKPRIYQIDRSPATLFEQWVKWEWQSDAAIVYIEEHQGDQGYVVIGKPNNEADVGIMEWRTPNVDLEKKLLSVAAAEIRRRHGQTTPIRLCALPQYMTNDQLTEWAGPLEIVVNTDVMLRNIRLPEDIYDKIKASCSDGRIAAWSGDFFDRCVC